MTWPDALDALVARTGHARYRALCADSHPDHDQWRAFALRSAGEPAPPPLPPTPLRPLPPLRLRVMVATCPARERCGCEHPRCHDRDFGPRHGYRDGPDWRVNQDGCLACVANLERGLPPPEHDRR